MDDAPRRKPGRPPLAPGEQLVGMHLRLRPRDFDRISQIASRQRCSMGSVVRTAVRTWLNVVERRGPRDA